MANKIISLDEIWQKEFINKLNSPNLSNISVLPEEIHSCSSLSKHASEFSTPITTFELFNIIQTVRNTLSAEDGISYGIIKHLPLTSIYILINIFNDIFNSGCIPKS